MMASARPQRSAWLVPAALVVLQPTPAAAHLVSTGLGPVYDAIFHVLLSPAEILPAATLALYAGLRGPAQARAVLFILPPAWTAAAVLSLPDNSAWLRAALCLLTIGLLLAANARVPAAACGALALALGLLNGGAEIAFGPLALAGAAAALFTVCALAASLALPLRRAWMIIAVRVAGSWMAALGLLLTGWWLRGVS